MRSHRVLAASLVAIFLAVGFAPLGSADLSGTWTTNVVGHIDSPERMSTAVSSTDERVGMMYRNQNLGGTGFAIFKDTSTEVKTNDISGNGTVFAHSHIAHATSQTWVALLQVTTTESWLYRTADDGETWTIVSTFTGMWGARSGIDAAGCLVVVAALTSESPREVRFHKSTDCGDSWTAGWSVSDNRGSPFVVGDQRVEGVIQADIAIRTSSQYGVVFAVGSTSNTIRGYEVKSTDAGSFWTIPYTAEGGTSLRHTIAGGEGWCQTPTIEANVNRYVIAWGQSGSSSLHCQMRVNNGGGQGGEITQILDGGGANLYWATKSVARTPFMLSDNDRALFGVWLTNPAQFSGGCCTEFDDFMVYGANTNPHQGASYDLVKKFSFPVVSSVGNDAQNVKYWLAIGSENAYLPYANLNLGERFEVQYQTHDTPDVGGMEPTATVAVNNLVGFAIDPAGSTVFARVDGGSNVTTHGSETLAESARYDTHCNQFDGVATSLDGTFVAFIGCDTEGAPLALRIRDNQLNDPSGAWNSCAENFGDDAADQFGAFRDELAVVQEIHRIEGFDVDLSNCDSTAFNEASMAIAFSTFGGRVGFFVQKCDNGLGGCTSGTMTQVVETRQFDTTSSPQVDQICVYRSLTDDSRSRHLVATTSNGASRVYQAALPAPTKSSQSFEMDLVSIGSGSFSGNIGVGCGAGISGGEDEAIFLAKPGQVAFATRTLGSASPVQASDTDQRGVAVSGSGRWAAYVDGGSVHVIDATAAQNEGNFTPLVSLAMPEGSLHSIRLDHNGQNAFIATSEVIARYSIFTETTGTQVGNPVEDFNPSTGDDGGGTSGSGDIPALGDQGIFGGLVGGSAVMFGDVGGRFFVAALMILGFATIGAGITAGANRAGASASVGLGLVLGAVLGFMFAVVTGVFPKTWAFIGVLVGVLGTIIWKALSSRGD